MAKEIVEDQGKYWIKESHLIEEVTEASLTAELVRVTADKTTAIADITAQYDARIAELNTLITEIQGM